jgi:hypothetical protein
MSQSRGSRFPPATLAFGAILASLLAVAATPLAALDPGTAKGRVVYEGTAYPLAHAIAVERANEFTKKKEIALILSDQPIALEDVADDWVEHAAARLTVTLDPAGKAMYAQL